MIRKATQSDALRIGELLYQVHAVHADARPDIFLADKRKYSDDEILALIADEQNPVFVYEDEQGVVQAYAFCVYQITQGVSSLVDRKVLFIDDLCVDVSQRGKKIGEALYQFVVNFAKETDCDSLTLNVWNKNAGELRFYQRLGLTALKTVMEQKLV